MLRKYILLFLLLSGCDSAVVTSSLNEQDMVVDGLVNFLEYKRINAGFADECDTRECEKTTADFKKYVSDITVTDGNPVVNVKNWTCNLPVTFLADETRMDGNFVINCNHTTPGKDPDQLLSSVLNRITLLVPDSEDSNIKVLPKMYRTDVITFSGKVKERKIVDDHFETVIEVTFFKSEKSKEKQSW